MDRYDRDATIWRSTTGDPRHGILAIQGGGYIHNSKQRKHGDLRVGFGSILASILVFPVFRQLFHTPAGAVFL